MASLMDRVRFALKPTYIVNVNGDASLNVLNYSAKQLYQTQDNVKAVVDYLANSVAQLPLKCYIRYDNNGRERDRTSPAAMLLYRPNSDQTAFEFWRGVAMEYYIFGTAYVWLIENKAMESGYDLRIIPNQWVKKTEFENAYAPQTIKVSASNSGSFELDRTQFVQFKTYSPGNPGSFVSPMAALSSTLQEQIEASKFRKELWHSSGRLNAQIIRPKDVQPWDDETRKKWIAAFREAWGSGGSKAGSIPLLEDGMEIKPYTTSFKEQQWAESIKLSREAVAAAYRVNPSLIWHSDTQTYASARDNARALYAECLGPDLQMFQQRINSFLLPMVGADPNMFVEFDLNEKLKGSFEERAQIMQTAVGAPWMTRDEARAYNNLPPLPDGEGERIIVPMNLNDGSVNPPVEEEEADVPLENDKCSCGCGHKSMEIRLKARPSEEESKLLQETIQKFFERQGRSVLPKLNATTDWWDSKRWDKELAEDITPIMQEIANAHGIDTANQIGFEYNVEQTVNYIKKLCQGRAKAINDKTQKMLTEAKLNQQMYEGEEDYEERFDTPTDVFDKASSSRALTIGMTFATQIAGWALVEAGQQAKFRGEKRNLYKEWVTGPNARSSHAGMNGERVLIDEAFSNGAMWPGDDNLDADESCGCNCTTEVLIM